MFENNKFLLCNRIEPDRVEKDGRHPMSAMIINTDCIMAAMPHHRNVEWTILWMTHDDPIVIRLSFEQLRDRLHIP